MSGPRALAETALLQTIMRVQLSTNVLLDNPKTEYLHKHGGQFARKPKNEKPYEKGCPASFQKKSAHR